MPAPSSVEEFLGLVRKSGLVDRDQLEAFLQRVREANAMPAEPRKLAATLAREGLLTYFQRDQLLKGKWRGFAIGKYDVLELLGAGGTGVVYLCIHRMMRHRVALKVLANSLAEDPAALESFYREAQLVAALNHPNILRAFDVDQDGPWHYLVMEYIEGSSLERYMRKLGRLDVRWSTYCIYQSALGLQRAHEAGLVHRDIKPSNLLVDRQGVVKIHDLGLARLAKDQSTRVKTTESQVVGTADYLAPEQALNGDHADVRSDIYSLGATFYFLLAGQPPFPEGSLAQKLIAHQTRQPKPIQHLRPEVPAELAVVLGRMMAKDPAQRYQTPNEVAAALTPWTFPPLPMPPALEPPGLSPAAQRSSTLTAKPPLIKPGGPSSSSRMLRRPNLGSPESVALTEASKSMTASSASAASSTSSTSPTS